MITNSEAAHDPPRHGGQYRFLWREAVTTPFERIVDKEWCLLDWCIIRSMPGALRACVLLLSVDTGQAIRCTLPGKAFRERFFALEPNTLPALCTFSKHDVTLSMRLAGWEIRKLRAGR